MLHHPGAPLSTARRCQQPVIDLHSCILDSKFVTFIIPPQLSSVFSGFVHFFQADAYLSSFLIPSSGRIFLLRRESYNVITTKGTTPSEINKTDSQESQKFFDRFEVQGDIPYRR